MPRLPPRRTLNILGRQADRVVTPPRKRRPRVGNRKTRQAAKAAERAMQRSLTDAVEAAREHVNVRYLQSTIERRDLGAAVDALSWETHGEPVLRAGHANAYQKAFNLSAELEAADLGAKYSVINRHALTAMEQAGARFVTQIGEGTRREVRAILTDMLNRGLSVRDTATQLMQRVGLTERLSNAVDAHADRLRAKGWAEDRVAKAMERKSREMLRYRASLIAQTEAQNAAAAGQRASWAEAVTQGLVDPEVAEQEWVTSSNPCPKVCDGMNGQRRKLGELFTTDDGRSVRGPGGETHPGCVTGDTVALSGLPPTALFERFYQGEVIHIFTQKGHSLTLTPNHPVLTRRGWIAAGMLKKGDDLVGSRTGEGCPPINIDGQDVPPRIEDVANALRLASEVTPAPVPLSAEDFHGDGKGSEVAVIWTDRLFGDRRDATIKQELRKLSFVVGWRRRVQLACTGALDALMQCCLAAARRLVGRRAVPLALFGGQATGAELLTLAGGSQGHASTDQPSVNCGSGYAELLRQSEDRRASKILADHLGGVDFTPVRHVLRPWFEGLVYNLSTHDQLYSANGIVVHNCLCTTVLHTNRKRAAA